MEQEYVRSLKQHISVAETGLEEIYLNYPCALNTDLYKTLIQKSIKTLRKLSLSLQDESFDPLILLREVKGSETLMFLKLNFCWVCPETLEIIGSLRNLTKLTGLRLLSGDIHPLKFSEMLEKLPKLNKMKVNCIEPYPECFFNPHPSLKKLKIECDSGSITPQAIKQISANKIEGFRLRIHWNRYIYRIEDIIRVT